MDTQPPPMPPEQPSFTPPHAPQPYVQTRAQKVSQWSMLIHVSILAGLAVPFAGLAAPIILWQIKKDELPELDPHGKNAANFAISMAIYLVAAVMLCIIFIGFLILPCLALVGIILPIIKGLNARDGIVSPYPLTIGFIK